MTLSLTEARALADSLMMLPYTVFCELTLFLDALFYCTMLALVYDFDAIFHTIIVVVHRLTHCVTSPIE